MLIGSKYKVESDAMEVTLSEKLVNKKTNEVYWKPIAYFSTVQNALKFMVDQEVNKTELQDFRAVVEKQVELYQLISSISPSLEASQRVRKPLKNKVEPNAVLGIRG